MFGWLKKKKKKEVKQPVVEQKQETVLEQPDKAEKPAPKTERKMSYHITKHPQGGWQIKKGKAERALKRFDTQKEAIDYAKQLEKERGISYLIHKADGSTRKKKY